MKRIYIVDEHFSSKYNGVGTFMAAIIPCLKAMGVLINLISYNENTKDFCIETCKDYKVYKIPPYGGTFLENAFPSLAMLRLYIKDSKDNLFLVSHCPSNTFLGILKSLYPKSKRISVIHDQLWTGPLLGNSLQYKKIINLKRIRGSNKDFYMQIRNNMRKEQKMFSLSHHVVCLCLSTYQLLHDVYHVPYDKISIIPNGIDAGRFTKTEKDREMVREEMGIYPDEKVLLFSGRVVRAKGIFHLLDAFEALWEKNHRLRLVIVGITESYQNYVNHIPKSISHVTFTGLIPQDRVYKWYKAADIGVLPSFTEQCSYTGLEMMASKMLVVTTNGNGICDMFDENCAMIVDAKEETMSADLAEALRKALAIDDTEKERMVELAYHKVMNEYSLRHMQDGYSEMLENLFKAQ